MNKLLKFTFPSNYYLQFSQIKSISKSPCNFPWSTWPYECIAIGPFGVFTNTKFAILAIIADVVFPVICGFLLYLHNMMLENVKLYQLVQEHYIWRLQTSLVLFISNGTAKTKLAIFAFLYCEEFVKTSTEHAIDHKLTGLDRLTILQVFDEVWLFTFCQWTHGFDVRRP